MTFEVIRDRNDSNAWRVEAIDFEDEGQIYAAIFLGPGAEQRAREYAKWKTASDQRLNAA